MKTQEIRITINRSHTDVFEYACDPANTPKWIEGAGIKSVNTVQIGLGTVYTNDCVKWEVTDYERDTYFELTDKKTGFQCSYTYHKLDEDITELVYFEYMQDGSDLSDPMNKKHFEKLKELLEIN